MLWIHIEIWYICNLKSLVKLIWIWSSHSKNTKEEDGEGTRVVGGVNTY